ncbi:hypothetical protein [Streptomyces sp. NPDC052225]|uniref:hypothetical protein n=1 Tax=Streptomyces sp. NPDC052225 TaxID=3154949 RepID=UPI00343B740D
MSAADGDSRDGFEDGLEEALRRTGEGFTAEGRALVDGGVLRGRRRLLRRRVGAVTGSVAALALVGFGTSYATGSIGGDGSADRQSGVAGKPTPAASEKPGEKPGEKPVDKKKAAHGDGPAVSKADVIKILEGLLPDGKVSGQDGRGTSDQPGPLATLVFDDGKGAGAISASVGAVDPHGATVEEQLTCPDKAMTNFDSCTTETLADGSRVLLYRGYEYPDLRVKTKLWSAFLLTPKGYTVSVSEWNAPTEKDSATTRPQPPLSIAQLKAVVGSAKWQPVMDALGEAPAEAAAPPIAQGTEKDVLLKTLKSQLPQRAKVVREGGQESEYVYVVVDDGKGESLVQINVQPHMSDGGGQLYGDDTQTLPDGTKVRERKGNGDDKGGAGMVQWTVDTLRKDGFRVVISAFNSGSQVKDATRAEPALTMAELKKIALSDAWRG